MSGTLIQALGIAIVVLALVDVFLTVLHARGDAGVFSTRLNRLVWLAIREVSRPLSPRRADSVRGYAGPLALVLTVALWVSLITLGFALFAWPQLGHAIRLANPGDTGFGTAIVYSGSDLTTLGPGNGLSPLTFAARFASFIESLLGISLVTLALTYFLAIYNALIRRNAFAAELHYMTARTGDAAELLIRIGMDGTFDSGARSELAAVAREMLNLLQTHHAYPVVHLFQQGEVAVSPARAALVALDTATLVRSVLDPAKYRAFIDCAAVEVLWDGTTQLLMETGHDILTTSDRDAAESPYAGEWRARYQAAARRLEDAGFAVRADAAVGEAAYARQRRRWDSHIRAFAAYRGQSWESIDVAARSVGGTGPSESAFTGR